MFDDFCACIINLDKQAIGGQRARGAGIARMVRDIRDRRRVVSTGLHGSARWLAERRPRAARACGFACGRCACAFEAIAGRAARVVALPAFDHFVVACIILVGVSTIVALESENQTGEQARTSGNFVQARTISARVSGSRVPFHVGVFSRDHHGRVLLAM